MRPLKIGFPEFTPFSDYEDDGYGSDECEGITEQECKDIANAVDISFIMALLDCSYEDMSNVIGELAELFDGIKTVIDYRCVNGNRICISLESDGTLDIKTEPPLDDLLDSD